MSLLHRNVLPRPGRPTKMMTSFWRSTRWCRLMCAGGFEVPPRLSRHTLSYAQASPGGYGSSSLGLKSVSPDVRRRL